jgi:hypothetical protein
VEEDRSKHLPWAVAVFPEGVLVVAAVVILVVASQEEVVAEVVAEQSSEISIHSGNSDIQERVSLIARYYGIQYQAQPPSLSWQEESEKKAIAEKLDGSYVLRTDQQDLTAEEIWRTYMLLTRVEAAFRSMKSPLMERPIFHHLKHRTQTHIFLCILAYHLLAAIEKRFLDQGIHTSWWSIRQQLSTHQVATIVLPTNNGMVLRIRKGSTPEPEQRKIYEILRIPSQVMKPIKTWHQVEHSD